jgi:anaerobic ribonucleoside-triphosphate reductase activating protein
LSDFRIGGITPLTSTDFPGCLAAVLFCQGCPWHCGYCHNPHLIPPGGNAHYQWTDVMRFLRRRHGLLDAVVFSGGEPTLQSGIDAALGEVRALGFKTGLHTGGPYPSRLAGLLRHLDWVGMDIKAPFADYARITGVPGSGEKAKASASLLLESGIAHEFRTTIHPMLFNPEMVLELAETLREMGVRHFVLQEFRPQGCNDAALCARPVVDWLDDELCGRIAPLFEHFAVRRA